MLQAFQELKSRGLVVSAYDWAAFAPLTAQLPAWRANIREAHGLGWRLVVCQARIRKALRRCARHGRVFAAAVVALGRQPRAARLAGAPVVWCQRRRATNTAPNLLHSILRMWKSCVCRYLGAVLLAASSAIAELCAERLS